MNSAILTAKLLALVEGKETPESWLSWWSDHESQLETELRSSLRNFESQNEYGYKPYIKRRFQNAETLQSRNQKNSS